jgi:hypothetical protein
MGVMTVRASIVAAAFCLAVGAGAGVAAAARQPTLAERAAITAALPSFLRDEPVGCVWLRISVSTNPRYAKVTPVFLNAERQPCLKYAADGYWIMKRTTGWKTVFNGSDFPACSLRVPRDLTRCGG